MDARTDARSWPRDTRGMIIVDFQEAQSAVDVAPARGGRLPEEEAPRASRTLQPGQRQSMASLARRHARYTAAPAPAPMGTRVVTVLLIIGTAIGIVVAIIVATRSAPAARPENTRLRPAHHHTRRRVAQRRRDAPYAISGHCAQSRRHRLRCARWRCHRRARRHDGLHGHGRSARWLGADRRFGRRREKCGCAPVMCPLWPRRRRCPRRRWSPRARPCPRARCSSQLRRQPRPQRRSRCV